MFKRICFTWRQMRVKKNQLKIFWGNPANKIKTLLDLPVDFCQKRNIKILVLDFDGVLAAHGEDRPHSEMHIWLEALLKATNAPKICVLSNNPLSIRERFFKEHFPEVIWITGVPKKPYPDGLLKISKDLKVAPKQICLIDDRILTGVLAAELAGTQVILVTKPVQAFNKHCLKECFFMMLRVLERWYVS